MGAHAVFVTNPLTAALISSSDELGSCPAEALAGTGSSCCCSGSGGTVAISRTNVYVKALPMLVHNEETLEISLVVYRDAFVAAVAAAGGRTRCPAFSGSSMIPLPS